MFLLSENNFLIRILSLNITHKFQYATAYCLSLSAIYNIIKHVFGVIKIYPITLICAIKENNLTVITYFYNLNKTLDYLTREKTLCKLSTLRV